MVQHVQVHQPHGSEVLRQCLALRVDTRKSAGSVEHAVRREPHADPVRADGSHRYACYFQYKTARVMGDMAMRLERARLPTV